MKRYLYAALLLLTAALSGCDKDADQTAISMVGGNPDRGRKIITTYGCNSCHTIPGINGADALVGPPLTKMAARTYVGGVLQNTPANMIHWIQNPPGVDPKTAMPNLHVTQGDARDIATYLYTLQ